MCVFAFLRGVLYRDLPSIEYYFKYDEAIFAILSQKFLSGDFNLAFHPYWNSGFPLISIPFYFVTWSWESSQVLVSMISHILLILVMYLTIRKISLLLALITSFFAAFSPSFTKLVTDVGVTEPFYVLLFWLAIYFGWQAVTTKKIIYYAFAGIFFGLAYLTRTEIIYTLSIFLLFALLSFFLKTRNFPSFNKVTMLSLTGGVLAYLYLPLTLLSKFTTFKFMIFRSARSILFVLPFALTAALSVVFERRKISLVGGTRKLIPMVGILLAVFLLINLPYILTISRNLGHLTLSGKYSYIGSSHPFTPDKDRLTTWAQDIWSIDYPNYESPYYDATRILPMMWKYLDHALEAAWKRIFTNLSFFAHDNIFTDFEAGLILTGFIVAFLQARFRKFTFYLFVLWIGSFVFISYFMDAAARYLAFSFPMFYIAQAFAVVSIAILLSKVRPFLLPFVIIVFTFWYFDKNFDAKNFTSLRKSFMNSDQKMIGDYLKSQGVEVIMARTEGISFYSGAKIVYIPSAPPEVVIEHAKVWGVPYILARPTELSWEYMRDIVNPKWKHPNLKLVHVFNEGTLLWKVNLTEEEKKLNYRNGRKIEIFCLVDPDVSTGEGLPLCPDRTY